ncbi:glycosyltransferase family 2 protein [Lachnospiraceae bacterium C1.1]|nr:glycosyltransferase family 2 protein [Lachnospiraceae bacterium C1.1]
MKNDTENENRIMPENTVSIVIPVYNSAKYLSQCLDSVLDQTWKDLDIVCVNDGSKDNSLEILKDYASKDSRVRVFSKKNEGRGAASARNMGLKNARGKYIQFLDSDDFFEADMVESLVRKAIDTGAEVVICRGRTFDDELKKVTGNLAHPDLNYAPDKDSFNWRECPGYICEIADNYAWNKLFKRQLLVDNDLSFTPIPISDDQDISMLAPVLAKKVAVIDRAFINYRVGTGNSQCDSQTRHPEAAYEGVYTVVERFKKLGFWEEVKQSYLNVSIRLMREYFDRMTEYKKADFLYKKYREEIFPLLEAENLPEGYFHDERIWEWYHLITTKTLEEIIFESARASGGSMTTAPLRFQVPYQDIKKNSRIVLVGKGMVGRYWYSQLLLSNYCEVIYWTDTDEHIPQNISFDAVVRAR